MLRKFSTLAVSLFTLQGIMSCTSVPLNYQTTRMNTRAPQFSRMNKMNTSLRTFNSSKKRPYGLGARVKGTAPMQGDGAGFSTQSKKPYVDLRPNMTPVYHQGNSNACVGFSTVAGLGEYVARKRNLPVQRFSPRYLWNMGRHIEKSLDKNVGMWLDDAVKVMDAYGMLPEQAFPFPTLEQMNSEEVFAKLYSQRPSPSQIKQAKKYRLAKSWKKIPSVHAMRKALTEGKPVVFAMTVFSSMYNAPNGHIPMPGPQDEMQGGHAIVAVGYDNDRRHFIIRNSWGTSWGDKGYGYLPYDYFRSNVKHVPIYQGFTIGNR